MTSQAVNNLIPAIGQASRKALEYTGTWVKDHPVYVIIAVLWTGCNILSNFNKNASLSSCERKVEVLKTALVQGSLNLAIVIVAQKVLSFLGSYLYQHALIAMSFAAFVGGATLVGILNFYLIIQAMQQR